MRFDKVEMRTSLAKLAALLSLAGCAAAPSSAPEGYVKVRWQVASIEQTNEICNAGTTRIYRKSVWGCAKRTFDECIIYTTDIEHDVNLHDTLGHELRHCFVGGFHY